MTDKPITLEEQAEADLFYEALGRTMARWSHLEYYLGELFKRITNMNEDVARGVFHSAKSWRSRYDMLIGALDNTASLPGVIVALKEVVATANRYAAFRNILAHDHVQLAPPASNLGGMRVLVIRPPKAALTDQSATSILRVHIERAGENIRLLHAIVANALKWDGQDQLGSPERLQWLLAQLPTEPQSATVDPSVAEQFALALGRNPFPN
jgi:hypothetical protein